MFLTTRVIVLHHFPYLGPADKGLLYTFPTSKWLFSCARAPTRGTSWAESGILFDEPDVLHSSYPAMSSQILFTTTTYGCLHVERNYSLSLLSHLYLTLTLTLTTHLGLFSMLRHPSPHPNPNPNPNTPIPGGQSQGRQPKSVPLGKGVGKRKERAWF